MKITKFAVVKSLVLLQLTGAAALSFQDIVHLGLVNGLEWRAYVAPFLIDGFAVLGALGRSHEFAEATRKFGFRLMVAAGLVSLVANVASGANAWQRGFGVLVVAGAVMAEMYAGKMFKAPEVVAAAESDEIKAKHRERGLKAAATRKANKERDARIVKEAERATRKAAKEALANA
jgi:hypothetical protein